MILSTLIIFILFTSTLSATTEKSIKYIEIKITPENKTTTTTAPKPTIPNKICEDINEETRKHCIERFRSHIYMMLNHFRHGADKKCILYIDTDLNKMIPHEAWPERFPKTTTTTPKTTPK